MQSASLVKELLSLSDDSSHILLDIVQLLDSFALFDYLSVNDRSLTFCAIVSAV